MAKAKTSLPKRRKLPKEGDVVDAICHDCAVEEAAGTLIVYAYDVLGEQDEEPVDRQHVTEVLLRAAVLSTQLKEEEHQELAGTHARLEFARKAGDVWRQVQQDSPGLNVQETAKEITKRLKGQE